MFNRNLLALLILLALTPCIALIAGCSQQDAPPKDPAIKAVWEQSQARRDARKAKDGM
jgi:hypothetical protein